MLAVQRSEEGPAMINGAHVIVYGKDPESDRAFFRDVLKFPAEKNDVHEMYFACDDLHATMESLAEEKVECGPVQEVQWGSLTAVSLPGGGKIGLYKPKHPTAAWPPLPLPKDEWKLKANANYQEVMKTLMTLMTASLVLPIWFIRNFLPVGPTEPIGKYLCPWAYFSWGFLSLSLVCGMVFYGASAKFVKVVCGGGETWPKKRFGVAPEKFFEGARDTFGVGAVTFFMVGLSFAGWFLSNYHESNGETALH
jgi:hypothetical protein